MTTKQEFIDQFTKLRDIAIEQEKTYPEYILVSLDFTVLSVEPKVDIKIEMTSAWFNDILTAMGT